MKKKISAEVREYQQIFNGLFKILNQMLDSEKSRKKGVKRKYNRLQDDLVTIMESLKDCYRADIIKQYGEHTFTVVSHTVCDSSALTKTLNNFQKEKQNEN